MTEPCGSHNPNGQTLIESTLSLFIFSQFVILFFLTSYLVFLSFWIPHILYENNICITSYKKETFNNEHTCLQKARAQLDLVLFSFENSYRLETYRYRNRQGSVLRFQTPSYFGRRPAPPILFREEIQL